MTIINLSQNYRDTRPPSIWNPKSMYIHFKVRNQPDIYYASSLSEIEPYFANVFCQHSKFPLPLTAQILMFNLEAKLETDEIVKGANGTYVALLLLRDIGQETMATYRTRDPDNIPNVIQEYGLNADSYIPIPKLLLEYLYMGKLGGIFNTSFIPTNTTKKKSLSDRISELMPHAPHLVPKPSLT